MLGVTMTETSGRESVACVVNHHGTKDDFVATIQIHIANGEVMEAVAKP